MNKTVKKKRNLIVAKMIVMMKNLNVVLSVNVVAMMRMAVDSKYLTLRRGAAAPPPPRASSSTSPAVDGSKVGSDIEGRLGEGLGTLVGKLLSLNEGALVGVASSRP